MANGSGYVRALDHGHAQMQPPLEKALKHEASHDHGRGPIRFHVPAELLLVMEMSRKINPRHGLYRDHGRVLVCALVQIQREPSPWLEKKDLRWCLAER